NSCLVEADEEPPHELNREALEIALKIALMLNAQILDEIHVMRKIVIDGSNTSGFQRTALIAVNGYLETSFGRIGIPTICLEEEAARKIEEDDDKVVYRLDRLGIPLVEISTSPDMKSGEEVREVAARIGYILRATKKVRRGVGTIRQDINISIGEGRVEIKGASRLNMIPKWVNNEIERQKMLRDIARILQDRDAKVEEKIYDLTDIFENTESRIIKNTLKRGGKILGIKLIGFQGVLKNGNLRLGKELAENVRVLGVKGLFHGDELPAYGISEEEVEKIIRRLELGPNDSFVIIGEKEEKVRIALQKVIDRAKKALIGVPDETRAPKDDGSTVYLRPLPGGARMYPETDIPPIRISEEYIEKLKKELPPLPDERLEELVSMGINREIGWQLIRDGMDDVFEELCTKYGHPTVVARALINGCEGIDYNRIFQYFSEGRFSKEAIDEIVMRACNGEKVEDIVRKFSEKVDIDQVIDEIMKEKMELVKERGMHAFKPLMGLAMQKLRGKVDGRIVSEKLRKRLEEIVNQESK
ncbi:MAG: Glu-tRNA(Gln) amidotransferase subunit GatE, partial [Thermoplasmata archaeon]|nr:Glu-tRNA(Gln) amidotransferase subunit GatE [Thermoplasmata archaeon]